ncbi:hypothetical protein AMTRI_Chr04g181840 [Amborella trichopoda]
MLCTNITCNEGIIPPAFWHNFKKGFHEAVLEGPSGNCWNVEVEEVGDALCFSRGWKKFVEDHSLNDGDFLVFYYDGDTHFLINIFDEIACERDDAFDVECSEKYSPVEKNMSESPPAIVKASENLVTDKQNEGAIQKAQSFRTTHLHFIVVMRSTLVSSKFNVTIPHKFVAMDVLTKDQNIKLQVPNMKNSWPAKISWARGKTRISSGWKKFVTDNDLKEGDACVFELSKARSDTFNILIFRA